MKLGPWLWSAPIDLGVFGGSALVALLLVALRHWLGHSPELPEWGFLAFVLAIDVAHVYSTLFRTYLDRAELAQHRLRYLLVPALGYAASVLLYRQGAMLFWRGLAYLALFHFVRQAAGWVAVYRARAGRTSASERWIDDAAVYSATLYPVIYWHAHLGDRHIAWFIAGDFVESGLFSQVEPLARAFFYAALAAFLGRDLVRLIRTRSLELGRSVVVLTTAATWYVGIVVTNSDFDFTVTNVITHGVPYMVLLFFYARARRADAPHGLGSQIAGAGFGAFAALLLFFAFVEELAWDRLVWHERSWLFGDGLPVGESLLAWLVPLLAVPQLTHYVLDGLLWRRAETRRLAAQRAALGFTERVPASNLVGSRA